MSAKAASAHLPNQEIINIWVPFPGRKLGKAAEPAISTDGKHAEKLQRQKVLASPSNLISPKATYIENKHSSSKIVRSNALKIFVLGAADGKAAEPAKSTDGKHVEKLQHQKVLASSSSLISPRATYLKDKHSRSKIDGSNPRKIYIRLAAAPSTSKDPFLPMKKTEPSHSHSKSVIVRSVDYRSNNIGAGKCTLKTKPTKTPNTDFSSLKQVKEEPDLFPRSNAIVGTSSNKATNMGHIGSRRTKDPAQRICEICVETKQDNEMIRINKTCFHSFCSICISKYIKTRITDNQVTVPCPGLDCKHAVEFQSCVGILPRDVLEAWNRALCKSLVLDVHKFYCPFRDCSAMLVDDSEKVVEECECPHCHRLFCAQCHVPWHMGVSCKEFQALNEGERGNEDLMVRKLATEMKWGRCPQCKFYVERTEGCPHITCRCGYEFCYGCGSQWSQGHGGCSGS